MKTTYNIRIINLSLGRRILESYTKHPLCQAVDRAWAAGNRGRDNSLDTNGYRTTGSPANEPYVTTVGPTRNTETATPTDDLVAPGNRIVSSPRP